MAQMFIITAETGEYADKCHYNLFVCTSREHAEICLRAIDNWFQLRGVGAAMSYEYCLHEDAGSRHEISDAFEKQFGVRVFIDYTGVEFRFDAVEVYKCVESLSPCASGVAATRSGISRPSRGPFIQIATCCVRAATRYAANTSPSSSWSKPIPGATTRQ